MDNLLGVWGPAQNSDEAKDQIVKQAFGNGEGRVLLT